MKPLTLAETLFVEMVDGRAGLTEDVVQVLAVKALEYAKILTVESVREMEALSVGRASHKLIDCPVCYGSGFNALADGKTRKRCASCSGTGRVKTPI